MAENQIQAACTSCGSLYKVPEKLLGKTVTCKKCKSRFVISADKSKNNPNIPVIGKLAVQYKFLSNQDLTKIMPVFEKSDTGKSENDFIKFLVKKGLVSRDNMNTLVGAKAALETRQLDKKFASIVLENGFSDKEKIETAIKKQTVQFQKTGDCSTLGDILVREGAITEQQKQLVFQKQNRKVFSINNKKKAPEKDTSENGSGNVTEDDVNKFLESYTNLPFSISIADIVKILSKENLSLSLGEILKKEGIITPPKKAEPKKSEAKVKKEQAEENGDNEKENGETEAAPVESGNDEDGINVDSGVIDSNIIEETQNEPDDSAPKIIESDFMDIVISSDNVEVKVVFKKEPPKKMNVDTLKDILIQNEISYGHVDDSLIYMHLNDEDAVGKPFLIAEGVAPQYGKEGRVTYHFDTDPVKVGALDESGHIDFRDRGEIPHVNEGELLADIEPAKKGVHGVDVFSNPILVPEIPDLKLRFEAGVTLSQDGKQAFANVDGQPLLVGGRRLTVLQELNISGDVGFKTGHVEFDGNVNITGTVQSGFKVKGTNITALEILGAEIEAAGNIQVIAGISGAKINSKGDIKAKYINKSDVYASGDIVIEKEIIDSAVENSGACILPRGKIISSSVSARRGIECRDIGTEMSSPCKIKIGGDDKLKKDVAAIDKEVKAKKVAIEAFKRKIEDLQEKEQDTHIVIAELAHVQDRSQIGIREIEDLESSGNATPDKLEQKKGLLDKVKEADEKINRSFDEQEMYIGLIEEENEKLEEVLEEIENLQAEKNDLITKAKKFKKTAFARVSGVLYAGSQVRGAYASVTVRETLRRIKIYESQTKDPMAATAYEMKQMKL